jgi:pimeloyl-ACP methyl ester carboxylesterase
MNKSFLFTLNGRNGSCLSPFTRPTICLVSTLQRVRLALQFDVRRSMLNVRCFHFLLSTPRRGEAQRRRLNLQLALKCLALALACLTVFVGCKTNCPATASSNHQKFTCVIVHGAWGGGWDWKHVDQLLTVDGHKVYRPTLTGQGERSHLASTNIDLDTHIQDVVNVILWEDLHDVVLVGHSYGGMVITGVADRVPDRIKHVVYLDAFVPNNGECANAIRARTGIDRPIINGFVIPTWITNNPPPPHDVPHPAKTFSQPISLTNQAVAAKLPTTYILTVDKGKTPEQDEFYSFYRRAQARGWTTIIMEGDHNVQRSHPVELVGLLEQAP